MPFERESWEVTVCDRTRGHTYGLCVSRVSVGVESLSAERGRRACTAAARPLLFPAYPHHDRPAIFKKPYQCDVCRELYAPLIKQSTDIIFIEQRVTVLTIKNCLGKRSNGRVQSVAVGRPGPCTSVGRRRARLDCATVYPAGPSGRGAHQNAQARRARNCFAMVLFDLPASIRFVLLNIGCNTDPIAPPANDSSVATIAFEPMVPHKIQPQPRLFVVPAAIASEPGLATMAPLLGGQASSLAPIADRHLKRMIQSAEEVRAPPRIVPIVSMNHVLDALDRPDLTLWFLKTECVRPRDPAPAPRTQRPPLIPLPSSGGGITGVV